MLIFCKQAYWTLFFQNTLTNPKFLKFNFYDVTTWELYNRVDLLATKLWGLSLMSHYTCSDPHTRKSIIVNFVVLYKPHAIFVLRKVRKNARINKSLFIELSVVA